MLRLVALIAGLALVPQLAQAQDALGGAVASQESIVTPEPDPVDSQEIGVLVGAAIGGGVSPGGLAVDGRYLYRMSDHDWFEVGANFVLGSGDAKCFRDRQSDLNCPHSLLDGFSAEATVGLRRYFAGQQQFRPYARAGLGLRLLSFSGDELRGVALPLSAGGGIRVDVANRVLVVAEANLRGGPAILGRGLGVRANLGLSIGAGVEFTLE
ncbi:MAG: hypothetical protein GY811_11435 [Myxococcales bacterium]|nr:hypothetical protein [Myxococcales bacterium]